MFWREKNRINNRLMELDNRIQKLERACEVGLDDQRTEMVINQPWGIVYRTPTISVGAAIERIKRHLGIEFKKAPYQEPIQTVKVGE